MFTRFLDKSVWVRYRVLQTLNNLASNNGLPRLEAEVASYNVATMRGYDGYMTLTSQPLFVP